MFVKRYIITQLAHYRLVTFDIDVTLSSRRAYQFTAATQTSECRLTDG